MRHQESKIQIAFVNWFNLQFPELYEHFFAVPNGGKRGKIEGGIMKAEGVKAGVADLFLLVPNDEFYFLAIEMKTETGKQSESQKKFQKSVEKLNFGKYVICRSFNEARKEVETYLKNTIYGKKF